MREERIMDALGSIRDQYVAEAEPTGRGAKKRKLPWIAAALAILLGLTIFTQTAPGMAAAEYVRERVASLIETLFPPREVAAAPEGAVEEETYVAGGQEPSQDDTAAAPGFAVYYDPERYEMTEENGVTYIRAIPAAPDREEIRENNAALLEGLTDEEAERKIDELLAQQEAFYASLPKRELEIRHVPDAPPEAAAGAAREEKEKSWETVSEVEACEPPAGMTFRVSAGTAWDSPVEDLYFVGDGQGGTYQITARYYVEAAEGQGARLTAILHTFQIIPPR